MARSQIPFLPLLIIIIASACATIPEKFPSNADLLFDSGVDAGTKLAKNNDDLISKNHPIIVVDMNMSASRAEIDPLNTIVKDALTHAISKAGLLLERESTVLPDVVREMGEKFSASSEGRGYSTVGTGKMRAILDNAVNIRNKGELPTAAAILGYRILDLGVMYKKVDDPGLLQRSAETYLFYEFIDSKDGHVIRSDRLRGTATDTISVDARDTVEKSTLRPTAYPMPTYAPVRDQVRPIRFENTPPGSELRAKTLGGFFKGVDIFGGVAIPMYARAGGTTPKNLTAGVQGGLRMRTHSIWSVFARYSYLQLQNTASNYYYYYKHNGTPRLNLFALGIEARFFQYNGFEAYGLVGPGFNHPVQGKTSSAAALAGVGMDYSLSSFLIFGEIAYNRIFSNYSPSLLQQLASFNVGAGYRFGA